MGVHSTGGGHKASDIFRAVVNNNQVRTSRRLRVHRRTEFRRLQGVLRLRAHRPLLAGINAHG